jgi:LytR cell envelope-related transcriptional attenuator
MPQQQTAIIPPPRQPWYRRIVANPRYVVLVVAGVLIIGGAAAFGVKNLSDDSGSPASQGNAAAPSSDNGDSGGGGGGEPTKKQAPAVDPAKVTVAVLNGTTVPGLAKQVSDRVAGEGFQVGTVANTADQQQQRAESVVLFAPGHKNEARAVSRRLSINQRQPIDPGSQALAGDATVVVIAGADLQ